MIVSSVQFDSLAKTKSKEAACQDSTCTFLGALDQHILPFLDTLAFFELIHKTDFKNFRMKMRKKHVANYYTLLLTLSIDSCMTEHLPPQRCPWVSWSVQWWMCWLGSG